MKPYPNEQIVKDLFDMLYGRPASSAGVAFIVVRKHPRRKLSYESADNHLGNMTVATPSSKVSEQRDQSEFGAWFIHVERADDAAEIVALIASTGGRSCAIVIVDGPQMFKPGR